MSDARAIETYFDRLWPICRSITGDGFRQSLDILAEVMPTERIALKTGQKVLDWEIPREWNVRDAYLTDSHGGRHAEFKKNNLHLLGYSVPFRGRMNLTELDKHIYTLPGQPTAIPYRTSYYQERWGFCMSQEQRQKMPPGEYEVNIESELKDGELIIGEAVLPGETKEEVLFSTYLCHPSMANNELSGPLVMAFLYRRLAAMPKRRLTYRFMIGAETIGAIAYLSIRGEHLKKNLIAGYQMTCVGDSGPFTYKRSRQGNSAADQAALTVLRDHGAHKVADFKPIGSDERQYCSPGFNLPVGSLMRTPYHEYPEYHTSLDDKSVISCEAMSVTVDTYAEIAAALDNNIKWKNLFPEGEPQLSKRGLYPTVGTPHAVRDRIWTMMWLLNLADGEKDLLEIARISGQPIAALIDEAKSLKNAGLIACV